MSAFSQPIFHSVFNQNKTDNEKLFDIRLGIKLPSSSMRYNNDTKEIMEDSLTYIYQDTSTLEFDTMNLCYNTDYTGQQYNLIFGFVGLKNLYIYAKLPITHTKIVEKFEYDTTILSRYERNNLSKTYIDGLYLDAGYTHGIKNFNFSLIGSLFIPFYKYHAWTGSTDEIINNKKIEWGKTFQAKLGTIIDFNLKPLHFELGGLYHHRAKDFTDQIHCNFLVGLSSVENTDFYFEAKYNFSLGNYKEEYKVDFWRETLWSRTLDVGIGFKMFFTNELYVDVGYDVCVWARNALAKRNVNINLGYLF